jgi:hypothetical protein
MFRARTPIQRVSRRIWGLIGGGALLFIGIVLGLAATHPTTPANRLVNYTNVWLFFPSLLLTVKGAYVSWREWRCPYCGCPLQTMYPIPARCPRCREDIGLYD